MKARISCQHCGTKNTAEIRTDDECDNCGRPLLKEQEGKETLSQSGSNEGRKKGNRPLYYVVVGALGMHLAGDHLYEDWLGADRYAIATEYALVEQCIHSNYGLGRYLSGERKRDLCICGLESVQTEYGTIPADEKAQM